MLWLAVTNFRTRCLYVVEDLSFLVPLFKLTGNKVVYYKHQDGPRSTIDSMIGNVCLSKADLILVPSNSGVLQFEKLLVVNSSEVTSGVTALMRLLDSGETMIQPAEETRNRNHGENRLSEVEENEEPTDVPKEASEPEEAIAEEKEKTKSDVPKTNGGITPDGELMDSSSETESHEATDDKNQVKEDNAGNTKTVVTEATVVLPCANIEEFSFVEHPHESNGTACEIEEEDNLTEVSAVKPVPAMHDLKEFIAREQAFN